MATAMTVAAAEGKQEQGETFSFNFAWFSLDCPTSVVCSSGSKSQSKSLTTSGSWSPSADASGRMLSSTLPTYRWPSNITSCLSARIIEHLEHHDYGGSGIELLAKTRMGQVQKGSAWCEVAKGGAPERREVGSGAQPPS